MNYPNLSILTVVILILAAPQLASSASAATLPRTDIATFKEVSSKIKPGMKKTEVVSILGKPDTIEIPKDNAQLDSLKAQEGLVYWHPEYATVHLLVGRIITKN